MLPLHVQFICVVLRCCFIGTDFVSCHEKSKSHIAPDREVRKGPRNRGQDWANRELFR